MFRKKEKIDFDGKIVEVYEIGVEYLMLDEKERFDAFKILELHTNLNEDEVKNLTIPAYEKIMKVFNELNKEHFEEKGEQEAGK